MPIGLAVAFAGGAGAFARYALDYYAGDHLEPHHQVYVTLAVNVIGSLLLGLLIGLARRPFGDGIGSLEHIERHLVKQQAGARRRRRAAELLIFAGASQIFLDPFARRQSVKAVHEVPHTGGI